VLWLIIRILQLADLISDPGTHDCILICYQYPDDQPGTCDHGYDEVQQVVGVVPKYKKRLDSA